jgi:acyl-CoA synthetase (NDP forming)
VLKSGKTAMGRRAVAGHTGALSGNDAIMDGVLQQLGLNRAEDFEDFFDMLEGFAHCPKAKGNRVAVVSITGVGCVLSADAASSHGLELAAFSDKSLDQMKQVFPSWAPVRNPVDMWSAIERNGVESAYQSLCEIALSDPGVDSLMVIFTLIPECQFDAASLMASFRERYPNKPLVACFLGGEAELIQAWSLRFRQLHIPVYPSPKRALRVLKALTLQSAQPS